MQKRPGVNLSDSLEIWYTHYLSQANIIREIVCLDYIG